MKQTTAFLTLSLIATLASTACLSEKTLKDIGFSSTQGVAIIVAPIICTDVFKTSGSCVPETSVKGKIEADNENLQTRVNIFTDLKTAMQKLADTVESTNAQYKTTVENILTKTGASKNSCIEAWSTIQQGVTCYLASGDASANTTIGSTLEVSVNTSTVGAYLERCLDYIDSICLLTAGMSISSDVTVTDSTFLSKETSYKAECQTLKANYSCITDACKSARYDTIINVFFKPYDYDFFPSNSFFKDVTNKLKDLAGKVTDWFKDVFSRRLLEDSDVKTKSSPTGADVKTHGDNSGQNKVTSGTFMMSAVIAAVVVVLSV